MVGPVLLGFTQSVHVLHVNEQFQGSHLHALTKFPDFPGLFGVKKSEDSVPCKKKLVTFPDFPEKLNSP